MNYFYDCQMESMQRYQNPKSVIGNLNNRIQLKQPNTTVKYYE